MADVRVRERLKIVPRLEVLSTTVKEFLKAFGASESCLDSVDKGVYQKQIIENFHLYYYSKKKLCGKITMNIDWEKHQVFVNSDSGKEFNIKEGESLIEQLDKASKVIVCHVDKLKRDMDIDYIDVQYTYRDYYVMDERRHNEARKYLGHTPAEPIQESSAEEFKTQVRFIIDKLKELEIVVHS